ncbi:MAG: phosphate signaling complex protein PhoU [Oscillospiraceae bacterium]|nr:phosphate signaling complex protein PhoU [Oscillospiraceae bacterium]
MRSRFDEQLGLLHDKLTQMGALCEDGIFSSMEALSDDAAAIDRTRRIEQEIDHAERDIESLCMKLLLHQQPVARDLRLISSALKMISDMERIGDQAADIAEITRFLREDVLKSAEHLPLMAKAAANMVTDSVESFVKGDLAMARQVQEEDDTVDALFDEVKKDLIEELLKDPASAEECLDLLMIAKYLERIGDHAVNVAEWVEYSITGLHGKER